MSRITTGRDRPDAVGSLDGQGPVLDARALPADP